jgi:hypothetical protein
MQPSALTPSNCQSRAFDGAPSAIDQDIWRIQSPLSVCDIGNASSHQFLARLGVLATARPIWSPSSPAKRPLFRLGRGRYCAWGTIGKDSTQNNRKKLQSSERNKDHYISSTRHTKRTKTFFLQGSVVQVDGSLESLHCRQSRKELGSSQDRQVPLWSRRPIAASGDLVGPPTFPLKSKLFLPQRLHSHYLQHWVLYAETTRPPQLWASQLFSSPQQYPYLSPTEGDVAKPSHHAIQNPKRSTYRSFILEFPKSRPKIYSEEHFERGTTGKTKPETIG